MNGLAMNEELMRAGSLSEMLRVINKYFDLDNCKPSNMIKQILYPKLEKAMIKIEADQLEDIQYMRTDIMTPNSSMTEIFQVLHKYFDLKNCFLDDVQKQLFIQNLNDMLKAVNAQPRRHYAKTR